MATLGELILAHNEELEQRWYKRWLREGAARPDLSEAVLKDHLRMQLQVIGTALLEDEPSRVSPRALWEQTGRLDPEQRVRDEVPLDEVVREYAYVIEEIRAWIEERGEQVSIQDYSYFSIAIFELAAESARRFTKYQSERVSRERSEYVGGIVHQLRSPVSTLSLDVQRLHQGKVPDVRTQERLRRTVGRLSRLVDGILRLERFKPDELPVHPESLAPAHVIDQLVEDFEYEARRKGLRLDVSASRSAQMRVDRDLLVDALGNLIQNAIKYTDQGFVRISLEEREEGVVFRVEDSGPGMGAERQRELFRPVRPGKPGGVGLGLNIAMRAAVAQGGTLEVQSEPGRGSTFLLRLPWTVHTRPEPAGEIEASAPTG